MFAVYNKNTKRFLYSTETEPVETVYNEDTDEFETRCFLSEDRGYVAWEPPAPMPVGVLRWEYDGVTNAMKPVMCSASKIAEINAGIAAAKARKDTVAQIAAIKATLEKYKEDVEQVELFGMNRTDYAEKKELCKNMVLQLRELEAQI